MTDTDNSSQSDFDKLGWKIIPVDLHEQLMEESFDKYSEIWKQLARR